MPSASAIIALMTLGNALNALVNNVYWSVVIDVTPRASVGAYSGITLAIANGVDYLADAERLAGAALRL